MSITTKKKFNGFLLAVLLLAVFLLPHTITAGNSAASTSGASYGLVLTQYKIKDYVTGVTVTDPNGREITLDGDTFRLLTVGEYIVDYGGGKKLTVTSSLQPPVAQITLRKALEAEYNAGTVLYMPDADVQNAFRVFENYTINVYKGDNLLKSIKAGIGSRSNYFFAESGSYTIEYAVTDEFGQSYKKPIQVTIIDAEEVFFDAISQTVSSGDTVSTGFPYGYYLKQTYPVTVMVKDPAGTETELKAPSYTFNQLGTYTFSYQSVINGKTIKRTQSVQSVSFSEAFSFSMGSGSIQYDVPLPSYVSEHVPAGTKGALVRSDFANAKFFYNKTIDLNAFTSDDKIIEFVPYSDADGNFTQSLRVTLTDVNDHSNKVALNYSASPWGNDASYVLAEFNGVRAAIFNTPNDPKYGTVVPGVGTTLYQSSFKGAQSGLSRMFSIMYDSEDRTLYTIARNNNYIYEKFAIMPMASLNFLSLDEVFKGFSTGEVFVTIELMSNANGGVYITQIGGEAITQESSADGIMIMLAGYKDSYPKGAVGQPYRLPTAEKSPQYTGNSDIWVTAEKDGTDFTSAISGGVFTPTQAGVYTISYNLDYLGANLKRSIEVEVLAQPLPMEINYPIGETVEINAYYFIPEISVSGGMGEISLKYKVTQGSNVIEPSANGGYYVESAVSLLVEVEAVDYIGTKKQSAYTVTIAEGVKSGIKGAVPYSVRKGETVYLPSFDAYKIADGNSVSINDKRIELIYSGGTLILTEVPYSFTVPNVETIEVRYQAKDGGAYVTTASFAVKVLPALAEKPSDLFIKSAGLNSTTLETGVLFKSTSDSSWTTTNLLAADDLYVRFGINDGKFNMTRFSITLTDTVNGAKLMLNFTAYDSSKGVLTFNLNGSDIKYNLSGRRGRYTENSGNATDAAIYKNKDYTIFEISVDTINKVVRSTLTGGSVAYLTDFEGGNAFTGFTNNACLLGFETKGTTAEWEIFVGAVSNQQFNYSIQQLGYAQHDNAGPAIISAYNTAYYKVSKGTVFTVHPVSVFDVVQSYSFVTARLTSPSGTRLINNATITAAREFTLDEYGYYRLVYNAEDSAGNKSTREITIHVTNDIMPTFILNGSYKNQYTAGTTLTILDYTADANTGSVAVNVYIKNANGINKVHAGDTVKLNQTGTYEIVYWTEDSSYNVIRTVYRFTVSA